MKIEGKCCECEEDAVVGLNSKLLCHKHFEERLKSICQMLRRFAALAETETKQ